MSNMFKDWKDMTPEQKKTEKIAITIMGIVMVVIASFSVCFCSGVISFQSLNILFIF